MSSNVASSSSSSEAAPPVQDLPRPEAGPLPRKLGEFGYVPTEHPEAEMREVNLGEDSATSLPARHPADRDQTETSSSSTEPPSTASAPANNGDADSQAKTTRRLAWGGVSVFSIIRLFLLFALMAGTGVAWWITAKRFDQSTNNMPEGQTIPGNGIFSSTIFVHVAFSVIALFELIFLERCVFRLRAERYIFKHGMNPRALAAASLGIAPWNRPPLPTYAAALAETGHGTGDVEDNMIAIAPPPAYGNTRGSTLLLSSMLPASLVRTFSRASQRSQQTVRPRSAEAEMEEGRRSRPLSYGASEEVSDATRALALEKALARLETNAQPAASTSSTQS